MPQYSKFDNIPNFYLLSIVYDVVDDDWVITEGCEEVLYAVTICKSSIWRLTGCSPPGLVGHEFAAL